MSRARAKEARAPSPQQKMTHNMMTRSKTRAAARKMDPDYDCLENNPRCAYCCVKLSDDDMAMCETYLIKVPLCEMCLDESNDNDESDDESDDDIICEVCDEKHNNTNIAGCCDSCHVENMCFDCGTWYEKEEVWRCPACVKNLAAENRMAETRWNDLDNYTMMSIEIPNNEAWAEKRLERQALNCYLKTTGKPWKKIRNTAACIAWCRAP